MKKIISTLFISLFSASIIFAVVPKTPPSGTPINKATFLKDDLSQIDNEFEDLQLLEDLVLETDATASKLKAADNDLIYFLDEDASIENSILAMAAPDDERPLGIGGFIWGFCLGLVGVIVVYVAIDDPELKKKEGRNAIFGCIVSTLIGGIIQFAILNAQ